MRDSAIGKQNNDHEKGCIGVMKTGNNCWQNACALASLLWLVGCSDPVQQDLPESALSAAGPQVTLTKQNWSEVSNTGSCRVIASDKKLEVRLEWDKPEGTWLGYHIYRAEAHATEWLRLTATPKKTLSHLDKSVLNGAGYRYRVEAVPKIADNPVVDVCSGEVQAFIAINNTKFSQCRGQEHETGVALDWTLDAADRVRVEHGYRTGQGPTELIQIGETDVARLTDSFVHDRPAYGTRNDYRMVVLKDFVNPFTGEQRTLSGDDCRSQITLTSALTVSFDGATVRDDGTLLLYVPTGTTSSVHGNVAGANGEVVLTFTSHTPERNRHKVTATVSNGRFQLTLPQYANAVEWKLLARDSQTPRNEQRLFVRLETLQLQPGNPGEVVRGWQVWRYPAGSDLNLLQTLEPSAATVAAALPAPGREQGVFRARSWLQVSHAGRHCLALTSRAAAQLRLADVPVLAIPEQGDAPATVELCADLPVGFYTFDVRQAASVKAPHLRLHWRAPQRVWEPLPLMWRERDAALDASDSDADGVPDRSDRFPDIAHEWFDRDGDGIGDHADRDRDGDGRDDPLLDAHPDDPDVEPGEPAQPVQAVLNTENRQLVLTWPAQTGASAYRVYRTAVAGDNAQVISTESLTEPRHVVADIVSGTPYRLAVAAVDVAGNERALSRDPIAIWPAWNDQPITACSAERVDNGLQLTWQPAAVLARIERKQDSADWALWREQPGGSTIDTAVRHGGRYQYRLNSVMRLRDPFRHLDVELIAPVSCVTPAQTVATELVLTLDELMATAPDQYELRPAFAGDYTVRGRLVGGLGPIRVSAAASERRVETVSSDGEFALPLVLDATHSNWQLRVEEVEAISSHAKQVHLHFILDLAAPEIIIETPQPLLRWQDSASISGRINDALTGIASARVVNSATGQAQTINVTIDGQFSVDVALQSGDNSFDVIAMDRAGNSANATVRIERDARVPTLTITSPLPGSTSFDERTDVRGSVVWRHDPALLQLTVNGQPTVLNVLADTLSFVASDLALAEGSNTFTVNLQSPVGAVTRSVTVERLVDQQVPSIVLEPLTEPVTSLAFITINGRITDDRSGISRAWLTSSRMTTEQGIPLAEDGHFSISVPLEVGENRLTFHAVDGRGNSGVANVTVTRDEGRPSLQINTPIEGTLTDQSQIDLVADIVYAGNQSDLQFSVNNRAGTIAPTGTPSRYRATVSAIPLVSGLNQLLVRLQFPRGVLEDSRRVTLDPDAANANDIPPALLLRRPLDGSVLSAEAGALELSLAASARPVSVTVNGQPAAAVEWLDPSHARIQHPFEFDEASRYTADVRVRDSKNRVANLTATFLRDAAPPQIVVDRLVAEPALNQTPENPFRLTGKVSDQRLTSITLNGQPLTLEPGSTEGEHVFGINVSLTPGMEQVLVLRARDAAGNESGVSYRIMASAQAGLSILLPVSNAEFTSDAALFALNVTTQVEGDPSNTVVVARVGQSEWATLAREGRFAQGSVSFPATDGVHEVMVELRTNDGSVLARQTRSFSLRALTSLPLQVVSTQPENAAINIEPNEFVAVHFNKIIDPSKLSITVLETAQGLTYQNLDPAGVDFTQARGAQLIDVSRNREPAPGSLSLLPGKRSVAFYPDRDLAYNGEVFVDVVYDGNVMSRFSYRTRPLPTFLGGVLVDPLGQPMVGIHVSLPDSKRSTVTDSDGAFAFGFGDSAAQSLPAGRQRLVINAGNQNTAYASAEQWATIEEGRLTDLGVLTVQRMNPSVAHRLVEPGNDNVVLADGGVRLDLSNAEIRFPDGARSGGMHAQFQPFHEIGKPFLPYAVPLWAYSLQPNGITVSGEPKLTLAMPTLHGSHDYLLVKDFYVLLIGANDDGNALIPVGVGHVQDTIVRSVGTLKLKRLDHLGIAMLPFSAQPLLQRYVSGELSWDELQAELMVAINAAATTPE